jgi:hypothetical protein
MDNNEEIAAQRRKKECKKSLGSEHFDLKLEPGKKLNCHRPSTGRNSHCGRIGIENLHWGHQQNQKREAFLRFFLSCLMEMTQSLTSMKKETFQVWTFFPMNVSISIVD